MPASLREAMEKAVKNWKAPLIGRPQVKEFSGGIISPKSLANAQSNGEGPQRLKLRNGRIFYRPEDLCEWILKKFE